MDYSAYIEKYRENIEKYKELGEEKLHFKSFGASSGVYQERSGDTYMVRPKTPGGIIDRDILETIASISKRYSDGSVRLSTRQDFQLHKIELEDTISVMEELADIGLYSIGSGGNTTRNVAASAESGVGIDDEFDITEYVLVADEYLSRDENNLSLPRKFKTAITSSSVDTGSVTFADIGFVAKLVDGVKKFKVYAGGGLGAAPKLATVIEEAIDADDILYHIDAMVELFRAEGDRENRAKARLRHLVRSYGQEKFLDRYRYYLEEAKKKDLKLDLKKEVQIDRDWTSPTRVQSTFLKKTKYKGIYSVYVHPRGGRLLERQVDDILETLNSIDHNVELRITNTQGLLIRDLGGREARDLIYKLRKTIDDTELSQSVCCVGASTCRVGINPSQELLEDILSHFKKLDLKVKRALPKLFISGCPSSCGQHQIGAISFSGKRKKVDGESLEAYSIYIDGRLGYGDGRERFAERIADILRTDIPKLLEEIALLKVQSNIDDIYDFIEKNREAIVEIIEKYTL